VRWARPAGYEETDHTYKISLSIYNGNATSGWEVQGWKCRIAPADWHTTAADATAYEPTFCRLL
jgi:hypothetical protein